MNFTDSMLLGDMLGKGKSSGEKAGIASAARDSDIKNETNVDTSKIVVKSGRFVGLSDEYEALFENGKYIGYRKKR